ncbi:MAG: FAD-binding oxidoreductase [Jatrophihabitantaceae bacterium]
MLHVSVLGGGVAGALLAWRLAQQPGVSRVSIAGGPAKNRDATAASGGLVRGYETEPAQRQLAIDSMIELLGDDRLLDWAGYTEIGSTYRPLQPAALESAAAELSASLPGSVELLTADQLRRRGWLMSPDELDGAGPVALAERRAGYLNPERLRSCVLADLAGRRQARVLADGGVDQLRPGGFRLAGETQACDLLVLAAGAWTPALLRESGWDSAGLSTKAIQYTVFGAGDWRPAAFVDEVSGLYGKATGDGVLLGLPTQACNVDPDGLQPDLALSRAVFELAGRRFPQLRLQAGAQPVVAADCYSTDSTLALRPVPGTDDRVFTFTGGSGGAAKTVLAASARAAGQLAEGAWEKEVLT